MAQILSPSRKEKNKKRDNGSDEGLKRSRRKELKVLSLKRQEGRRERKIVLSTKPFAYMTQYMYVYKLASREQDPFYS